MVQKACVLLVLVVGLGVAGAADWPQWGGPGRDFTGAVEADLASTWPEAGPPVLWSRDLGGGSAAVLAVGDTLYAFYRPLLAPGLAGDEEVLAALDADTGEVLWQHSAVGTLLPGQDVHTSGKGPHATPLVQGDKVYALGFGGLLRAVDRFSGALLWQRDLPVDFAAPPVQFGFTASPLAYEGTIIAMAYGPEAGMVAFNAVTGETVWRSSQIHPSYASPMLVSLAGEYHAVVVGRDAVWGIDPDSGAVWWRYELREGGLTNAPSVLSHPPDGLLVSGQGVNGVRLLQVIKEADTYRVQSTWLREKDRLFIGNALLRDGVLYAGGERFLFALDAADGEVLWRQRGFADGKLVGLGAQSLIYDNKGALALARLGPQGAAIDAEAELFADGRTWAAPTVVGDRLYVRDQRFIAALDLGAGAQAVAASLAGVEVTFLAGQAERADWLYQSLLQRRADIVDVAAMDALGKKLLEREQYAEAAVVFQRNLDRFPSWFEAFEGLRSAYAGAGDTEALAALEAAFIRSLRLVVEAPPETPAEAVLYVAGSHPQLGSWKPDGRPLQRVASGRYSIELELPRGIAVEYKITRGSWDAVERDSSGADIANRRLPMDAVAEETVRVEAWADSP